MALQDSFTTGPWLFSALPVGSYTQRGQVVTPSASYDLESIGLWLYRVGTPGTLTVEVYAVSGGLPDGGVLASGTTDADTITTSSSGELIEITLSSPLAVTSGTQYAIVYYVSDGVVITDVLYIRRQQTTPGEYAGGDSLYYDGSWHTLTIDQNFWLYGTGTAPSKPTNPTPDDEENDVDFSGFELSWDDGGGADTFDVYIGNTGDLTLVSSAQAGTTYTTDADELETIFGEWPTIDEIYWRIDATNEDGTTSGDEWHFATAPKVNYTRLGATGNFILCTTTRGLYLSTDFGSNWTQSLPDADDTVEWNRGVCSGTGTYMIVERDSDHALYRSANGGSSWGAITPAGGDTFAVYDMAMSEDGQYVVIVGANSTTPIDSCYISTDYGATWTAYEPDVYAYTWITCDISDNGEVIGVAAVDKFYMSFNGGTSWQEQFPPSSDSLWNYISISGDGKVGIVTNSGTVNEWFINSGYYNSITVDNTILTSFARTLIDDTTAAEARTTLSAQTQGDVLDDLNTLGAVASDGQFIVGTGAGVFAYESGDTARTSLGLGSGDSPTHADVIITGLSGSIITTESVETSIEELDAAIGGLTTDHGSLLGLGDDDHTQYLLTSGARAMTGQLDLDTYGLVTTGTLDASAGEILTEDAGTARPILGSDGHVSVAEISSTGRIYFTVEGKRFYVDGTEDTTGFPMGLLLSLTYSS